MSLCVMAGRAAGVPVIDGVHNQIDDTEGFARASAEARDFGFDGKSCIHPVQVAPANAAFTPSAEELAWARAVLAAFAEAPGMGVISLNGRMIEGLDAERARRLLARAAP
jgi:citrate lyase subunit beta/citryl-CoA lyase